MSNLPATCAARNPVDNTPVIIHRGSSGYVPLSNDFDVDAYNVERNITSDQIEAMLIGSMFGWHTPGAAITKATQGQ